MTSKNTIRSNVIIPVNFKTICLYTFLQEKNMPLLSIKIGEAVPNFINLLCQETSTLLGTLRVFHGWWGQWADREEESIETNSGSHMTV